MVATPERRTQCVRIEPKVGDPIRIAIAYPVDLVMGNGARYLGGLYADPSDTSANVGGGATVLDITSVYSADSITRDDLQSGKWDGARVYSFYTDWAYPVEDEEPDRMYTFGKVREQDQRFVVEMMSLTDLLNQQFGRVITPGCVYTFADSHIDGTIIASDRSRCKKNPADYTVFGAVTAVHGVAEFSASALSGFHDDHFGFGEIIFTTGKNAGMPYRFIKRFTAGGRIALAQHFYYPVEVGDQFKALAGCRKRYTEDCIIKFNNAPRFGGYPHVPQKSTVSKFGDQ